MNRRQRAARHARRLQHQQRQATAPVPAEADDTPAPRPRGINPRTWINQRLGLRSTNAIATRSGLRRHVIRERRRATKAAKRANR